MPLTDLIQQQEGGTLSDQLLGLLRTFLVNPLVASLTIGPAGGVINQPSALAVNGAIAPNTPANYVITKAGVLADTLAAPTVGTSDGVTITITSNTANAHTLTATGLLQTGTASVNVATFAAFAGASLTLQAYQGKWNVLASNGITFS
jgi:hypothetical protein